MKRDILLDPGNISPEEGSLRGDTVDAEPANGKEETIVVARGRIPSPLEETLIDYGKDLIKDSVTQSVEFHKTMLGLTASFSTLMASAFGILAFGLNDKQLDNFQRAFLVVPVLLMLLSSVCFALGYYPRSMKLRLRVINTIEDTRNKLLQTRRNWAFGGILFFILSIVVLVAGIVFLNLK
jgi:hypothetical protein